MTTRRELLGQAAGALAGIAFTGCGLTRGAQAQIVKLQNEKVAEICGKTPDRFVGLASVALAYPDLAAEQLQDAVKRLGMRGALIGGSVNGTELSDPKLNPFWANAEELGIVI